MPRLRTIQQNFTAGELSPLMKGRTDIKQYYDGCELARNVFLSPQGGARRREGMEYIDDLGTVIADGSLSESRCISFEFSTTQTYKLVLTDYRLKVYLGKALQATVTTVFPHTALSKITWCQSFDTLLIFHEDYPPQKLVRGASHTSWTISAIAFTYPQYRFVPVDTAITPTCRAVTSGPVGLEIQIFSSASAFVSGDVGKIIAGNSGRAKVVEYVSATEVKALILEPFFSNAYTSGWYFEDGYEDAWSATRGYPRCGAFYQGRLFIGGSRDLPQNLWASRIADYFNFNIGQNYDNEAIDVTIDTDKVCAINNLNPGRTLQIFTTGGEFYIPLDNSSTVTPNNIGITRATSFGSKYGVQVESVDGEAVFVNRSGGTVRGFVYQNDEGSYISEDKALLSNHLIRNPSDIAFRKSTELDSADYLFLVNDDGTLAVFNTNRSQAVSGWSLIEIDGKILSIGIELDTIFVTTERTINGVTARYIEYFDTKHSLDCSVYHDSTTASFPSSTFTGLDHLNGETVLVIADGSNLTPVTVSGGSATIERDATSSVEFGLSFAQTGDTSGDGWKLKQMPVEAALADGTMLGKKKRLVEVTVNVYATQSLKINGQRVSFRKIDVMKLDEAPAPYTGQVVVEGILGYSDEIAIEFGDSINLPANILSAAYKVAV